VFCGILSNIGKIVSHRNINLHKVIMVVKDTFTVFLLHFMFLTVFYIIHIHMTHSRSS